MKQTGFLVFAVGQYEGALVLGQMDIATIDGGGWLVMVTSCEDLRNMVLLLLVLIFFGLAQQPRCRKGSKDERIGC